MNFLMRLYFYMAGLLRMALVEMTYTGYMRLQKEIR